MELISVPVPSSSSFFSYFSGMELIISYSSWTGTSNGTENKTQKELVMELITRYVPGLDNGTEKLRNC